MLSDMRDRNDVNLQIIALMEADNLSQMYSKIKNTPRHIRHDAILLLLYM